MADNVAANSGDGAGPSFATDLKAGDAHWPIGKVAWGTRDSAYNIVDLANALPVQPGTGATFPVSGTFWQTTQPVSAAALPLPTGAATSANQATEITSLASIATSVGGTLAVSGTFWQATQPVSIGAAVSVTGTFFQATQPVSAASLPLPTGASTDVAQSSTTSGQTGGLSQAAVLTAAPTYVTGNTNPLTMSTSGEMRVQLSKAGASPSIGSPADAAAAQVALYVNAQLGIFNGTNWDRLREASADALAGTGILAAGNMGWNGTTWDRLKATSGVLSVDLSATSANATALKVDGSAVNQPTKEVVPTTATLSNVAGSATSVNVVASNASRRGLTIYNDSTARVRLKFGTTASSTSFTYSVPAGAQWEMTVPFTGAIDGIWDAANGNARVTEMT